MQEFQLPPSKGVPKSSRSRGSMRPFRVLGEEASKLQPEAKCRIERGSPAHRVGRIRPPGPWNPGLARCEEA
jgi:hypothetical protein